MLLEMFTRKKIAIRDTSKLGFGAVVLTVLMFTPFASLAATIQLEALVGPVVSIEAGSPEGAAGFIVGEDITLHLTIDDTTIDSDATIGSAVYSDLGGTLMLTGSVSGATLSYLGGVRLSIDDSEELEIQGIPGNASAAVSIILDGDIDFDTRGVPFFSNPDSLMAVLDDLSANTFPHDDDSLAHTEYWDGNASAEGMSFGPPPSGGIDFQVTAENPVPEPTSALLFGIGLLTVGRRRFWNR